MTATDTLRAMLDERGVEYYVSPNGIAWGKLATPIHGRMYTHYAVELDGFLCVESHCITPEQAIAATLGDADLAAENAKLREELEQWHKLTAGIELPEYPITQFQPKDLERENAKLIEFASAMYRSILLVPDNHIPAEIKARYFKVAVSLGLDVPDD